MENKPKPNQRTNRIVTHQLKAPRKERPEKGNQIARRRMPSNWRADNIRHRCKQLTLKVQAKELNQKPGHEEKHGLKHRTALNQPENEGENATKTHQTLTRGEKGKS